LGGSTRASGCRGCRERLGERSSRKSGGRPRWAAGRKVMTKGSQGPGAKIRARKKRGGIGAPLMPHANYLKGGRRPLSTGGGGGRDFSSQREKKLRILGYKRPTAGERGPRLQKNFTSPWLASIHYNENKERITCLQRTVIKAFWGKGNRKDQPCRGGGRSGAEEKRATVVGVGSVGGV